MTSHLTTEPAPLGATICSGIGSPEVALPGFRWVWCAEIEPFPCAVLAQRHPQSVNLGDVMAIDFLERAAAYGPLDLLVAGTPCQAFSVAGLRKSLGDHRGNLTLRFVEIVHAIKPVSVLWENVPGVLSTHDNAFGCFLGGLVGASSAIAPAGRWTSAGVVTGPLGTAAWRVLDAQYHGLAQRRARVFVIFSPGNRIDPAEVLFEWESLRRDYPPSREAGQGTTGTISARTSAGGGLGTDFDLGGGLSRSLRGQSNASHRADSDTYIPTVSLGLNGGGMNRIDAESESFIAHALRADGFDASEDGTGRGTPLIACGRDVAGTLKQRMRGATDEVMAVRRLTPVECERLQGFPDGYTAVEYRGKPAADGPRYRALGNAMAVPVIGWIGGRILKACAERQQSAEVSELVGSSK